MTDLKAYRQKIKDLLSAEDAKTALVDMGVADDMATTLARSKGLSSARILRAQQK
jgi:hypothetical protein